ncbi:hypothetical protein LguiA_002584 [Lonicera macranthoides]
MCVDRWAQLVPIAGLGKVKKNSVEPKALTKGGLVSQLMQAPTFGSPLHSHDDAKSQVAHLESKPNDLESQKKAILRPDLCGDQSQQLDEQEPKPSHSDLVSRYINFESRLDIVEPKFHGLQSDVHDFKFQVCDLKAEVLDLKAEILDLKSQVPDHRSQVPKLKAVVVDLKSQVNDLKFKYHEVVAPDLKSQVHVLEAELLNLKSQVPDLKAEFLNIKPWILDLISPGFDVTLCCLPLKFSFCNLISPGWFQRFYKVLFLCEVSHFK